MEYFIGGILLLIVLMLVAIIFRKKLYNSVEYYEDWKLQVMNRNVAAELLKIKNLNLKGETKDKFEHWRGKWDDILHHDLSLVEEQLFEAEHYIDVFRFKSANKTLLQIDQSLEQVDQEIDTILAELDKLLDIEKTTKKEESKLRPLVTEIRRKVMTMDNRVDRAKPRLNEQISELETLLDNYDLAVEEGNYEDGQQIVAQLQQDINDLEAEVNVLPGLYIQCKETLPEKLDRVLAAYQALEKKGYQVAHFRYDREINGFYARLLDCVNFLEKEGTEDIAHIIENIDERTDEMLANIDQEETDKEFIETKLPTYKQLLERVTAQFAKTKEEVEELKLAYFFEADDMNMYQTIDQIINEHNDGFELFAVRVMKHQDANSSLRQEMEERFSVLEKLEGDHEAFKENIKNLRKDELEARDRLREMNERLNRLRRKLRTSNLPGIPNNIWSLMEDAQNANEQVIEALQQQPLDMTDVQRKLSESERVITEVTEMSHFVIDQAQLTEHVIQYANRYRSANPILHAQLTESERLFHAADYELALEKAANAIEEVEPGALKRIEKYQETVVS